MKTGFSPAKVGGIACCDHKMSSASSLSPYQAVCCTEHSALALGAGHTSKHPSPPFASLVSLTLSVSFFLQWPTLPFYTHPLRCHPQALGFHSVSAGASVLTKQRAFRRHIKPCPSSVLLGSSANNKRTGTPVQISALYGTQQHGCRQKKGPGGGRT